MQDNKKVWVALVVVALIALGAYAYPKVLTNPPVRSGGTTNYDTISATRFVTGCNDNFGSGCTGSAPTSGVTEAVSVGSCNATIGSTSYSASSTLFGLANPFSATSSATVISIIGTGQATTSSLLVGTSTTATGITSTTVTPSLVNSTNGLATTTQFIAKSGYNTAASLGSGQIAAGSNAFTTIVVGPNEFVTGYSTTTATGAGAAGYIAGQTCTYKVRWQI